MNEKLLFASVVMLALMPGWKTCAAEPDLTAHSRQFKRELVKVTDGIHVAVGYGLANSILIEGKNGVVIVDTLECAEVAQAVRAEFRKLTRSPVRAIIYTHHHPDHIFGARIFAGEDRPTIYAHRSLPGEFDKGFTGARPAIATRAVRMYGLPLDDRQRINAGVGARLALDERSTLAYLPPTKTFAERLSATIADVTLELVHAPGETEDHLFVWLPEQKVLLCGDNFYHSFPNLYTIRGTPYRKVKGWIDSLDRMRDLKPAYLVPSHGQPLAGTERIAAVLTDYRDAIQYVHDQTLRGLNRGLTPDELVESIKLPPHLARAPYLQEYYGKVSWCVRSIYNGHLGWFDGDATELLPLPPRDRAERMAALAGGEENLLRHAEEAVEKKDHQWALELTGHLLRLNAKNEKARVVRVRALSALGASQGNAPAHNYYLTQAWELREGKAARSPVRLSRDAAHALSLGVLFESLAARLDPAASKDVVRSASFRFSDTEETFTVHVRRGVAEVRARLDAGPELEVSADSKVWKEVLTGVCKLDDAFTNGKVKLLRGERRALDEFMDLFRSK
ncbi:MAG TPA: alkyl sulfatase dimerization domain-containing protein [Gemmataceae bacterium]|nr:alkyl sulfatase dimerization domain-containing protein [Gemmataceae bacterium]